MEHSGVDVAALFMVAADGAVLQKNIEVSLAVSHKATDFDVRELIAFGAAPDSQCGWLDAEVGSRLRAVEKGIEHVCSC